SGRTAANGLEQIEHVVQRNARVRKDQTFRRGMSYVALVPHGDVVQGGHDVTAQHARQTADALAELGIAFVRHRARALLAAGEWLERFADLGALESADLGRLLLQGRGDLL